MTSSRSAVGVASVIGTVFIADGQDPEAWDEALHTFNAARSTRTARVQTTARVWGESWHVSGIGRVLRNLLFQSRADGDFRYNEWLYGEAAVSAVDAASTRVPARVF